MMRSPGKPRQAEAELSSAFAEGILYSIQSARKL